MTTSVKKYYKILRNGQSCHNGTHTWEQGVTYEVAEVSPCYTGFHACRIQDLQNWLIYEMEVYEIELTEVVIAENKVVGRTAKLGTRLGALTAMDCARVAVFAARKVAHLNTDPRVIAAILAVEACIHDPSEKNRARAADATRAIYAAARAATCAIYAATDATYAAADADNSIRTAIGEYILSLLH